MGKVFHFNPSCEMEVANKLPHFSPPKQVQNLLLDGQQLPVYFTQAEDCVFVNELPSQDFLRAVQQFEIKPDVFHAIGQIQKTSIPHVIPNPWGWSPTEAEKFKAWFPKLQQPFLWKQEYEHWYRRESSTDVLKQLVKHRKTYSQTLIPVICTHVSTVENLLSEWGQMVLKSPLSSSGRGVLFLRKKPLNASNKQWIQGVIDQQGNVMVERMWDRMMDFSFHFYKNKDGAVEFVGETAFLTNSNGKYKGNFIGDVRSSSNFPAEMKKEDILVAKDDLIHAIENHKTFKHFSGFLGVDMMIYREDGGFKIHPCVEINARQSMGLVAIHLQKWIKRGVKAKFLVELKKDVDPNRFYMEKQAGKISDCYWPLSDYWRANQFVFMLRVGEET